MPIRKTIVVLYGPTGSGKVTFIEALRKYLDTQPGNDGGIVHDTTSSIDLVKEFTQRIYKETNSPKPHEARYRQQLADVKHSLDLIFGWSVQHTLARLESLCPTSDAFWGHVVLITQIRETENIQELREICNKTGIQFLAVAMNRRGKEGQEGASTDRYDKSQLSQAEWVIWNDGSLEKLSQMAAYFGQRLVEHQPIIQEAIKNIQVNQ